MRALKCIARSYQNRRVLILGLALANLALWALPGCFGPEERSRSPRRLSERSAQRSSLGTEEDFRTADSRERENRFSEFDVLRQEMERTEARDRRDEARNLRDVARDRRDEARDRRDKAWDRRDKAWDRRDKAWSRRDVAQDRRDDRDSLEPLAADGGLDEDGLLLAQADDEDERPRARRGGGANALEEIRRREDLKLFEAEFESELGDRAFEQQDYAKASNHYERALRLNPTLSQARERLHSIKVVLNKREGQAASIAQQLFEEDKVRAQQIYEDSVRGLREARELMKEGDLERADRNLRKIRDQLEYDRDYPGDVTDLRDQARALLKEVGKLEKRQKNRVEKDQQELVQGVRKRELEQQERQRKRQVRQLLGKAFDYIRFKEYDKVIDACKRILKLEPRHELAKFLLKDARSQIRDIKQTKLLKLDRENLARNAEDLEEAGIPWQNPFVFPDEKDWKVAQKRLKNMEVILEDDPEPVRHIKNLLETTKLTFRFEEMPLLEVVESLRQRIGVNISVDPSLDTEMTVDLAVEEMKASDALKLILEQTGLGQTFHEQVLYITEREKARGSLAFQIYNVADILNKIRDFSGPTLQLKSTDDDDDTGSGVLLEQDEELDETELEPDELIDLIKDSTGGEVVWGELNSIEFEQGLLFVNAPRELHVEIQGVLSSLRKDSDIFVMIEARFIDITDDFLEDIGVDYRGLGTVRNLGTPFGNVLNLPGSSDSGEQRVRNDLGFVRQGSPDRDVTLIKGQDRWAGRMQHLIDGHTGTIRGERLQGGASRLGGLTLQGTWLDPFQINAIVRAVQEKQDVRQLTAPTVTAHNGQRVYVSVITQRAYIADYELVSGGTGFQIIEVADPVVATFQEGVILDVDPVISPDKKFVTMDVRPTMATLIGGVISTILISLGSFTNVAFEVPIGVPRVALQQSFTSVTVPNGGTVLLGGFKSMNEAKFVSSMPLLQHVPLLKNLARRKSEMSERQSLVILLTAKIINPRAEESAEFNDA